MAGILRKNSVCSATGKRGMCVSNDGGLTWYLEEYARKYGIGLGRERYYDTPSDKVMPIYTEHLQSDDFKNIKKEEVIVPKTAVDVNKEITKQILEKKPMSKKKLPSKTQLEETSA